MRLAALLSALAVSLALVACGASGGGADPKPKPSPRGEPVGPPVTVLIGTGGGEVTSADGLLTLVLPPGALTADIEVGIQPLGNTAPHGLGKAYRIVPADLRLAEPMLLQFHDQTAGHGEAWQDSEGIWRALPPVAPASLATGPGAARRSARQETSRPTRRSALSRPRPT